MKGVKSSQVVALKKIYVFFINHIILPIYNIIFAKYNFPYVFYFHCDFFDSVGIRSMSFAEGYLSVRDRAALVKGGGIAKSG